MKKDVLGIKIDDINMDQALELVQGWLSRPGKHYIVTPNPEIIMTAQKDQRYKSILNDADLSIPDGIGLKLSGKVKNHITGVDLMEKLIRRSVDWGSTVAFLGGNEGVAEKAADCLRKKYPKLKISFAESGGEVGINGDVINDERLKIKEKNHQSSIINHQSLPEADILFVAFGPPKQEKWIAANLGKIPVKIAMGVGGSLDYISGEVPRAPLILRKLGLEWLFRLIIQPWRIKRQAALIKYVWLLWTVDGRR